LPVVPAITGVTSLCVNGTTQLSNTTTGGVWSTATNSVATINSTGLVTGVAAGTVTVSYVVTNTNACQKSVNTTVTVATSPTVTASANPTTVSKGLNTQLNAASTGSIASYSWTPSVNVANPASAATTARVTDNTTYKITVTNSSGCSASDSVKVTAIEDLYIEATNVFTPNGDGINDKFVIKNLDQYPNNKLQVFDRTGKVLYQQDNYANNWDGYVNGKLLTKDTYLYILSIKGQIVKRGTITLVR